jgi:hypothetical protein
MKAPPINKIHPAFWLAIVLAVITTSCATNVIRPAGSNEQVKGATLLIQRP